jgi:hypothetical protein
VWCACDVETPGACSGIELNEVIKHTPRAEDRLFLESFQEASNASGGTRLNTRALNLFWCTDVKEGIFDHFVRLILPVLLKHDAQGGSVCAEEHKRH